ncbi:hypothetical protein ES332_A07G212600v1 [Gossypium tomentosum]|uniref:Reverse transcriptase zinc-binding domain-containing protein n=1 Tax=Gossypium tomentosum TaxID=34277 RepID=A0A5D2PXZ3_GOSTO|nr:hypothetical protein ES332_A07G212600v1 [Gossypium tomentosum]
MENPSEIADFHPICLDQLLWAHDIKGEFSVKQLSKLLLERDGDDSIFVFDRIWKLKVPPKVRNFIWLLAIDRVPTKDFLIKRGVKIRTILNVCPWCNRELKRTDHLFFKCNFIAGFWRRIFNWWDVRWKEVNNFEEFYSSCFKVKFVGSCKSLWLIAIARSLLSMATLIFHSKMRALLWVGAAFEEYMIQERLWWFCPYKCSLSKSGSRGWCYPPHGWLKFNAGGTASEGASGCGGVMRDEEGSVRVFFSGPYYALGAVITALDIFIEIGWKGGSLIILDKKRRSWSKQATFADLERRIAYVGKISFSIANLNSNEMAETLATAGMSRPCLFKAWW